MEWIAALALGGGLAALGAMVWAAMRSDTDPDGGGRSLDDAQMQLPRRTEQTFADLDADGETKLGARKAPSGKRSRMVTSGG